MALTPMRWIAGLIIGCLAAAVFVLRSDPERRPDAFAERARMESRTATLTDHASTIARRLHLLQLLDSVRPSVARADPRQPIRVFRDATLTATAAPEIDWLIDHAVRPIGNVGRVPLDLIFVYDTLSRFRGARVQRSRLTASYLLPIKDGDRCTVITRVNFPVSARRGTVDKAVRSGAISEIRNETTAEQLLGPCAYYRAFGMPGAAVAKWLGERALSFTADDAWDHQPPPVFLDPRAWRYFYQFSWNYYEGGYSLGALSERLTPLVFMTPAGSHCALGDPKACERVLTIPERGARLLAWNGNVASAQLGPDIESAFGSLGPREGILLAEMVRSIGRDRFTKFWTSSESVPAAFEKAAGESLGSWTARWANATYEPGATGPGIGVWSGVFSVLFIALGILTGMLASERRQYQ